MIDTLHALAQLLLAVFVFFASLCRLAPMHALQHKFLWVLVYFGMAAGAVTAGYEVSIARPSWAGLIWGLSAALYLWNSRVSWKHGVPKHLNKGCP